MREYLDTVLCQSVVAKHTLNSYFQHVLVYLWSCIEPQIRCMNRIATNTVSKLQRQTRCLNRSNKYAARWFDTPWYQITRMWFGTLRYQIIGGMPNHLDTGVTVDCSGPRICSFHFISYHFLASQYTRQNESKQVVTMAFDSTEGLNTRSVKGLKVLKRWYWELREGRV